MNSVAVQTIQQITPQLGYEYAKEKLCHEFPCGKRYVRAHRPRRSDPRRIQLRAMRRLRVHRQRRYVQHTTLYTKILDHDGNVLIENPTESHQSVKESTAALLTSAMQSVVQAGSDGAAALDNMPVAGKTGTADNDKTSGSAASPPTTPARCGAVTTIPSPMSNIGTNFRFQIWKAIMSRVHAGLEYKDFTMPASVEQKTICTLSGQLARPRLPGKGRNSLQQTTRLTRPAQAMSLAAAAGTRAPVTAPAARPTANTGTLDRVLRQYRRQYRRHTWRQYRRHDRRQYRRRHRSRHRRRHGSRHWRRHGSRHRRRHRSWHRRRHGSRHRRRHRSRHRRRHGSRHRRRHGSRHRRRDNRITAKKEMYAICVHLFFCS